MDRYKIHKDIFGLAPLPRDYAANFVRILNSK